MKMFTDSMLDTNKTFLSCCLFLVTHTVCQVRQMLIAIAMQFCNVYVYVSFQFLSSQRVPLKRYTVMGFYSKK